MCDILKMVTMVITLNLMLSHRAIVSEWLQRHMKYMVVTTGTFIQANMR